MPVYELPDLTYDYGALEPKVSGRVMALHHSKHHAGYVDGANRAIERMAEGGGGDGGVPEPLPDLERNLAFNLSGHLLHSRLWRCMSPDGGGEPGGDLADAIDDQLGGFKRCRALVTSSASSIQGSGWAALAWEPTAQRLVVEQLYDHHGNVGQGTQPLLVLDAWEHAYYLDHENNKSDWFESFWDVVDWDAMEGDFERMRKTPAFV